MFFYQFPNQPASDSFPCYFIPQFPQNHPFFYVSTEGSIRNNILISAPAGYNTDALKQNDQLKQSIEKSSACQSSESQGMRLPTKATGQKKGKKQTSEEQFKPYAPETKKGRKTPQNGNRNVVPNIMHQVISFMQKKNKSGKMVERVIQQLELNQICSVKRFYLYQQLIKDKLNYYVNADSLIVLKDIQEPSCQVYSEQEQRHYNKISRMLAEYFLKQEFDSIILTSKRVSADKRLDHLRIKRKILARIAEMLD